MSHIVLLPVPPFFVRAAFFDGGQPPACVTDPRICTAKAAARAVISGLECQARPLRPSTQRKAPRRKGSRQGQVLQIVRIFELLEAYGWPCCFVLLKIVILPVNQKVVRMRKNIYQIILLLGGAISWLAMPGQSPWRPIGPDNLTSVPRSIVFDEAGNLLAGMQGGGLWRSINLGESWEPVTSYDEQAMLLGGSPHVSDIAVDGDILYVATGTGRFSVPRVLANNPSGEYLSRRSGFVGNLEGKPGAGVLVSLDNGATWQTSRNATNPTDPQLLIPIDTFGNPFHNVSPFSDIITIAAKEGLVLIGTASGLYYSTDRLATVDTIADIPFLNESLIFDIEFAGTEGNERIFVSAHAESTNPDDRIYVADFEGGSAPTFTELVDERLFGTSGFLGAVATTRLEVAVAPSNPNIVYLGAANSSGLLGVFRTDLSTPGEWTRVAERGSAAFAPLGANSRDAFVLEVYPDNENELILAGQRWFTFTEENGWVQTASHGFSGGQSYLPTPIYVVTFNPSDPTQLFIGTGESVRASFDRGETFAIRSKGLETGLTFSVASFGFTFDAISDLDNDGADVVLAGLNKEISYNAHYNTSKPSNQGHGIISQQDYSRVAASYLYPGALLAQGSDGGLVRSTNRGEVFEAFYNLPIVPGVQGLATADTFVNATSGFSQDRVEESIVLTNDTALIVLGRLVRILNDSLSLVGSDSVGVGQDSTFSFPTDTLVSPNNDSTFTDSSVTVLPGEVTIEVGVRTKSRELTVQGSMLAGLRPSVPQSVWILDEVVPPAVLDSMQAEPGTDLYREYTTEELRAVAPSYIFYCSSQYMWLASQGFGEILQTKWNRLTDSLVDGETEFFTAITVSGDTNHTVYLGTSLGNIWRIDRAHDIANFDARENVVKLTTDLDASNLTPMRDRWITDLAVDPNRPERLAVSYAGYGSFTLITVPSGVYITDQALVQDTVPLFAPLTTVNKWANGRLTLGQCYSVAFVEREGQANASLLIGTERELLEVRTLPEAVDGTDEPEYVVPREEVSVALSAGNVPVYDIVQRPYTSVITEGALVREQEVVLPSGETEVREVEFDRFQLEDDNTVFVATYGRGVWADIGLEARTGQEGPRDGLGADLPSQLIALGPNPATLGQLPTLHVNAEQAGRVSVGLYDLNGRYLAQLGQPLDAGAQALPLEVFEKLERGLYFVQVQVRDGEAVIQQTFKVRWER